MLSVDYISNFLIDKQTLILKDKYDKINNFEKKNIEEDKPVIIYNSSIPVNKFDLPIPESFNMIFNNKFYYNNRIHKNKSNVFTFFNSLLMIGDQFFNFFSEDEKEIHIKKLIKIMDDDLFDKDLYNKFGYTKNTKFNKADIQEVLKLAYQFKSNNNFNLLKNYVSDYLGINLFIMNISASSSEKYLPKYFDNSDNIKNIPMFCILLESELYKPILVDSVSILVYSLYSDVIDNLFNYLDIKIDVPIVPIVPIVSIVPIVPSVQESLIDPIVIVEPMKVPTSIFKVISDSLTLPTLPSFLSLSSTYPKIYKYDSALLKKMKIDEIKKLCIEENIPLQKKSEKTSNMINKFKDELIENLLCVYLL